VTDQVEAHHLWQFEVKQMNLSTKYESI